MLDVLKEFFPVEAIAPAIGGALVWFGANYAVIGPEIIAPRMQEKYYAPVCQQIVANGTVIRAQEERALMDRFDEELRDKAGKVRQQVQRGAEGFFGLYGDAGAQFWNKWGSQLGGGLDAMTETRLSAEIESQREQFLNALRAKKAEAQASVIHRTPSAYCGCLLEEALSDRFDVAAFTASLRLYKSPAIRNIESGAIYSRPSACGAMPVF